MTPFCFPRGSFPKHHLKSNCSASRLGSASPFHVRGRPKCSLPVGSLHQPPAQEEKRLARCQYRGGGRNVGRLRQRRPGPHLLLGTCLSFACGRARACGEQDCRITGVSCVPSETVTALGTSTSTIFSPARSEMRSWGVSSMSWSPCRAWESSFSCTVVLTGRFDTLVRCSTAHFPHSGQALGLAWQVCDSESDKRTARRVTVRSLSRWLWSSKFVRVLITHGSLSARHT